MWAANEARLELRKGTLGDGISENDEVKVWVIGFLHALENVFNVN